MTRTDLTISRQLRGPQLPTTLFDVQERPFDARINLHAIQAPQQEFLQNVESLFCPICVRQPSFHLSSIVWQQRSQEGPPVHDLINGFSGQGKSNAGL